MRTSADVSADAMGSFFETVGKATFGDSLVSAMSKLQTRNVRRFANVNPKDLKPKDVAVRC